MDFRQGKRNPVKPNQVAETANFSSRREALRGGCFFVCGFGFCDSFSALLLHPGASVGGALTARVAEAGRERGFGAGGWRECPAEEEVRRDVWRASLRPPYPRGNGKLGSPKSMNFIPWKKMLGGYQSALGFSSASRCRS